MSTRLVHDHAVGPGRAESYVAGIINHGSYDDLADCLRSVEAQTIPPIAIFVVDTGVDPKRLEVLVGLHPSAAFEQRENRGWGAGVNRILARAEFETPETSYALILNPDVQLAPDFASVMLTTMRADPSVAIASGKLLRPDRTSIDTAGIRLPRNRRPRDRGSGERDRGQFDRSEEVFAVSGAAMMMRRSALADLALAGEIVDEDFFAYHDDTDLCWRAHLFGWRVWYQPAALGIHGRRWRPERRRTIELSVRRHSFKNHYLQILKNERGVDLLWNLPWLLAWEMARFGFAVLADRGLIPAYLDALRGIPSALQKRRLIRERLRDGRLPVGPAVAR